MFCRFKYRCSTFSNTLSHSSQFISLDLVWLFMWLFNEFFFIILLHTSQVTLLSSWVTFIWPFKSTSNLKAFSQVAHWNDLVSFLCLKIWFLKGVLSVKLNSQILHLYFRNFEWTASMCFFIFPLCEKIFLQKEHVYWSLIFSFFLFYGFLIKWKKEKIYLFKNT